MTCHSELREESAIYLVKQVPRTAWDDTVFFESFL